MVGNASSLLLPGETYFIVSVITLMKCNVTGTGEHGTTQPIAISYYDVIIGS